ncbi:MAG: YbaY family lipoprotein [Planctomycetaceae bacterium]|nr:YbaY family lipoprotein [Planctomycetaceae bacterium]
MTKLFSTRWIQSYLVVLASYLLLGLGSVGYAQDDRNRDESFNDPFADPNGLGGVGQSRYLPPGQRPPTNFRLGIYSRNTDTGVLVTSVNAGSAAQQSGIEAQDIIIAVNGYQVGIINGRTYDIADELARRVDAQGRVMLLVRNHRDGRLVNIPVQFYGNAPGMATSVYATANTANRPSVQPGMMLMARVIDTTFPQWQNVSLGETQVPLDGRWPVNFQIDLDPSQIRPDHRYALDVKVVQRGYTVLQMNSPATVNFANGNPRIAVTLVPPQGPAPAGTPPGISNRPIDQIGMWYEQLAGRPMNDRESQVWQRELAKGKSLDEIYATVLASSEYYDRFRGNMDLYINEIYRTLFGRSATPSEVLALRNRLSQSAELRIPVLLNLVRQRTVR